ncbi:MAG TPA: hypothetical protein VN856_08440, partial [Mycobacterium sp.]|uniref:hypothetical protein n=1 Tax=Mycobacterium sp. TaxID=1785 RepID=UPI002D1CE8E4
GDMNLVAAATGATAAAMAPADLASRAVPVVRVDRAVMTLEDPVGMTPVDPADMTPVDPADMTLEDPVDLEAPVGPADTILVVRVGMTPADPGARLRVPNRVVRVGLMDMILVDPEGRLRAANPVVRVEPERLVVPNPVARAEPGSREATDLRMGRAPLGRMPARPVRMPTHLHLTVARRLPMPVDRRTPVDRRRDPTTRAVPTCQEATRAVAPRQEATRAVAIRRAAATPAAATLVVVRRAAATPNAERNRICPDLPGRQVRFCRQRYLTPSTA